VTAGPILDQAASAAAPIAAAVVLLSVGSLFPILKARRKAHARAHALGQGRACLCPHRWRQLVSLTRHASSSWSVQQGSKAQGWGPFTSDAETANGRTGA
jgi:hypothetical protein